MKTKIKYLVLIFTLIMMCCNLSFSQTNKMFNVTPLKPKSDCSIGDIQSLVKDQVELINLRTKTSKTYKDKSGKMTFIASAGNSINYLENGIWKEINNDIKENKNSEYEYSNLQNSFKTHYSKQTNKGIKIEFKEGTIYEWISPQISWLDINNKTVGNSLDANISNVIINNDMIIYSSVFQNIDLKFTQQNDGKKMDYILKDINAISNRPENAYYMVFHENIIIPENFSITPVYNKTRKNLNEILRYVIIKDEKGNNIITYQPPKYYDNNYESIDGEYIIEVCDNEIKIGIKVPIYWLSEINRSYPVIIDPTGTYYNYNIYQATGYVDSDCYFSNDNLWMGFDDQTWSNPFINGWSEFDISALPAGQIITEIKLYLYKTSHYAYPYDNLNVACNLGVMSTRPSTYGDACTLYDDIYYAPANNSIWFNYYESTGWWYWTFNTYYTTALQNAKASHPTWFAFGYNAATIGTDDYDDGWGRNDDNIAKFAGYSSANRPYIVVKYCTNPTVSAGPDQNVCDPTTSAVLAGTNPGTDAGLWTIVSGCSGCSFVNNTIYNTTVNNIPEGTSTLRWTITKPEGCTAYDDMVIKKPTTPTAGVDATTCTGSYTLGGNNPIYGTGAWSVISGAGTFTPNNTTYNAVVSNLNPGNNTFRWSITHGCTETDDVVITYSSLPTATITTPATSPYSVCSSSQNLVATNPAPATGVWSAISGGGTIINPTSYNTASVTNMSIGDNIIRWTVTGSGYGCINQANVTIRNNLPTTANAGPDQFITTNSTTLAGNVPGTGCTGQWTLVSGAPALTITPPGTSNTNTVTGISPGVLYTLQWTISNALCPSNPSSDQMTIYYDATMSGLVISNDLINDGSFIQTNDPNSFYMTGTNRFIKDNNLGLNNFVDAKIMISGSITFGNPNGSINNGKFLSTTIKPNKSFTIYTNRTYKNHTLLNNATLTLNSGSVFENSGDWTNNNSVVWENATPIVKFNGDGNVQLVNTNSTTNEWKNIVLNNKDGSNIPGTIRLLDEMPIATTATFTYGIIDGKTNSKYFTVKDNATVSGANDNSFVNWTVKKIGNDNFKFPTGCVRNPMHDGYTYVCGEIGIDNTGVGSSVTDVYYATYRYYSTLEDLGIPFWPNGTNMGVGLHHVSEKEYWDVTTTNNIRQVTLYTTNATRSGISDISDLTVAHWETNIWNERCNSTASTYGGGYSISSYGLTSYSPISFGSKTGKNPLPVELISFDATCNQDIVNLTWQTMSEINNDYFTIYRTIDFKNWEFVTKVNGSGNSNNILSYSTFDLYPLRGLAYYRLSQTDNNGETKYFPEKSVICDGNNDTFIDKYEIINVYNDKHEIKVIYFSPENKIINITMFNSIGQKIYVTEKVLETGTNSFNINSEYLSVGIYYISILDRNNNFTKKIVIN